MDPIERSSYRHTASGLTVLGHLFGLLSVILVIVWLLHYRGGLDLHSDNVDRIFNVHPFLMFCGFILFTGEAMMAYKTVAAQRKVQKNVHMALNLTALFLGIIGLHAAFKFHDKGNIKHMYSMHSWIGIGTFSLFLFQWLAGFGMFLYPGGSSWARARALPWHVCCGRAFLYMAICAALTGMMEKVTFLQLQHNNESHLINFTALSILLFGIFVDLSVGLGRYA